jgi:hypothetical protein
MKTTIRVCNDRCPGDYGKQELLEKIESRLEIDSEYELVKSGCLRICQKLGGTNNRPACGVGNFEVLVEDSKPNQGVFMITEEGKIKREFLE